jgi:hypothetical protein
MEGIFAAISSYALIHIFHNGFLTYSGYLINRTGKKGTLRFLGPRRRTARGLTMLTLLGHWPEEGHGDGTGAYTHTIPRTTLVTQKEVQWKTKERLETKTCVKDPLLFKSNSHIQ